MAAGKKAKNVSLEQPWLGHSDRLDQRRIVVRDLPDCLPNRPSSKGSRRARRQQRK